MRGELGLEGRRLSACWGKDDDDSGREVDQVKLMSDEDPSSEAALRGSTFLMRRRPTREATKLILTLPS